MIEPLWDWRVLVAASGGVADGVPAHPIMGFSIDSRGMTPGDVFVALKDQRDGHDFVPAAFANGAAAALVSTGYERKPGDGALIRVADTLKGLEGIARVARARLSPDARIVAVTGSVGKTGTKEMLRACLSRLGTTHAPEKSFNNHWGVPLTLARMPHATLFGVFEIGMNHAGEITPLTRLVRPHAAIITTVEAVHLGHFRSVDDIADAKAEVFSGIVPGGAAVLNCANQHFARLRARAIAQGLRVVAFGRGDGADVRLDEVKLGVDGSEILARLPAASLHYRIGAPGEHMAMNSAAVLGAIHAIGADPARTIAALATFGAPPGRGAREILEGPSGKILLVDESYNANPASIRAALAALALVPRNHFARRIAVLGDMLELGEQSTVLHAGLKDAIDANRIDLVFAAGPHMKSLYDALAPAQRGAWAPQSDGLLAALGLNIHAGDAIMVKGSFGSRMGPVVEALRTKFGGKCA